MTRVVNIRRESCDVYIGRGSPWGNPFSHLDGTKATTIVGSREEAVERYRAHLWRRIKADPAVVNELAQLRGKRLGCYCAPKACHGDILSVAAEWAFVENERQVLDALVSLLGATPR